MSTVWIPRIVNLSSTEFEFVHTEHNRDLKFKVPANGSLTLDDAVNKVPWQHYHHCMKLTATGDGTYHSIWQQVHEHKDQVRANRNGPPEPGYGATIAGDADASHNFVATLVINADKSLRLDCNYSKTALSAWKVPLGFKVFDREIGDHTWVVGADQYCEPCRFGVEQEEAIRYYNNWVDGRYVARKGWTKIAEHEGLSDWARLLAGKPYKEFVVIPGQGNVLYAVNGVCHTLTNRLHWGTGLEVMGATGYDIIRALFGRYGLNIPGKLVANFVPGFNIAAAIYQIKVLLDWQGMRGMFGPSQQSLSESDRALDELHAPPIATLDTELSANELYDLAHELHERHIKELEFFDAFTDSPLSNDKRAEHIAFWREFHAPPSDLRESLARDYPKLHLGQTLEALDQSLALTPDQARAGTIKYNDACADIQRQLVGLLGAEDYRAVYGRAPDQPLAILDPTIMSPSASLPVVPPSA